MKLILTGIVLFLFSFSFGQSLVVDEIMTIDESSVWPFTWEIEVTSDNTLYVGNELGQVYFKEDDGDWTELALPETAGEDVRSIKVGDSGRIWIGTEGSGIHMLDGDIWTSYTIANAGLLSDNFKFLEVAPNGNVFGGRDNGIFILIDGEWFVANSDNGSLDNDYIKAMGSNPTTGNVYAGGGSFLYTFTTDNQILSVDLDDEFGWDTQINCFYADGERMLIGTKKGLLSVEGGVISDLRSISGQNKVDDIAIDAKGNIWLGRTFFGLSIYDGEVLHEIGSSDTIPNQIFDMVPYKDNVLLVGNRGARLASAHWDSEITSVNTQELEGLALSPTATDRYVYLSVDNKSNQNYSCEIYSGSGVMMATVVSNHQLDLSGFASGAYYIRVKDIDANKYFATQKVIKI